MSISFFWLGVGESDLLWAGCGWMWVSLGGCRLVWPFFGWVWVGVGECDLFLAGCGWVWVSVTFIWLDVGGCGWVWLFFWLGVGGCGWVWHLFGWMWVGVGECDLFLAGCGWVCVCVCVSAQFITALLKNVLFSAAVSIWFFETRELLLWFGTTQQKTTESQKQKCWGKITGPSEKCFPKNVASPPSESKNSNSPPWKQFLRNSFPSSRKGGGHYGYTLYQT